MPKYRKTSINAPAFIRTWASEPPASIRPAFIRAPPFKRTLASNPRRLGLLCVIIPSIPYVNVYSFVIIEQR